MTERARAASGPLRVVQISTFVQGGGAERIAWDLHVGLRRRGHDARLAVGSANRDEPGVVLLKGRRATGLDRILRGVPARALAPLASRSKSARRLQNAIRHPGAIRRALDRLKGREAFEYPESRSLLDSLPWTPDVIHGHNLHGGYFDLRYLPVLARAAPLVLTLHDEWLNTGHCAYSLGCERWRVGCGMCPDLAIYPSIARDGTAENFRIKRALYADGPFFVAAPSRWLLDRARVGVLSEAALDFRVIPNGVDTSIFNPVGRAESRARLGIEPTDGVLLFAANLTRSNPFKDHATVTAAARRMAETATGAHLVLICLGEPGPIEQLSHGEIRQLGYESDPHRMADYYRAADLYLHAAHADNAPLTILEALACGTPVVATATGGIPEQIRSLAGVPGAWNGDAHGVESATGVLVPPSDPESMASAATALLADSTTLARLAHNAVADVAARYSIEQQVNATVAWYRDARRLWDERIQLRRAGALNGT